MVIRENEKYIYCNYLENEPHKKRMKIKYYINEKESRINIVNIHVLMELLILYGA